jgi:hypothetical protein
MFVSTKQSRVPLTVKFLLWLEQLSENSFNAFGFSAAGSLMHFSKVCKKYNKQKQTPSEPLHASLSYQVNIKMSCFENSQEPSL